MEQDELFPGNRIEREVRVINASDDRYRRFVSAYLVNGMNATKAAIAAGYSEATAMSQGSRLLKRPEIAEMIAEKTREQLAELDYSVERTLREVAKLAFFDSRRVKNADGSFKDIAELDDMTAAAVTSIHVVETSKVTEERSTSSRACSVKFAPRAAALDMLMRYHALYKDRLEVNGKLTLEALVTGEFTD